MNFTVNEPIKAVNGPSKTEYDKDEDARIDIYGPTPINPFTELRLNRGLSINQLALSTRVNNKALNRLEKGMYVNPLPRVVDHWLSVGVVTEGELLSDYENFRYLQRRRNMFYLGPSLAVFTEHSVHPLRQLRSRRPSIVDPELQLPVGLFEFCEALCLPLDSIQHFEKKWRTVQSVPKELKLALNQTGYTREQISTFERHYLDWRRFNSPKVKVS
jgi:transcriptional regulator with XRE-family HTH domain